MPEHSTNSNYLHPVTIAGTNVLKYALGHVTPVTFLWFSHLQSFDVNVNQ